MGYLKLPVKSFLDYTRNPNYVDKSLLIEHINSVIDTDNKCVCMIRPRRFGKTLASVMLNAYYNKRLSTKEVFDKYLISKSKSYENHLNKYNVIYIDMTGEYLDVRDMESEGKTVNLINYIKFGIIDELKQAFKEVDFGESDNIAKMLTKIYDHTEQTFIIIIDEWDSIFREEKDNHDLQKQYVEFLRMLFKTAKNNYAISLAYITGILPIVKYGTQSALNNFTEYSLIDTQKTDEIMGFTEEEVKILSEKNGLNPVDMAQWYDGYLTENKLHIYNPWSVMQAIKSGKIKSHWAKTDTVTAFLPYVTANFEGVKDDILQLLAGGQVKVEIHNFKNNLTEIKSKSDVLVLFMYYGYLSYDAINREVFIPNQEIRFEISSLVEEAKWENLVEILQESEKFIDSLVKRKNKEFCEEYIRRVHLRESSIIHYNDENSLACTLGIAFFAGREYYCFKREMQAGEGFADFVLLPRLQCKYPPMVIELKVNKDVETALNQIKNRNYPDSFNELFEKKYEKCLLVAINYDEKEKKHSITVEDHYLKK